MKEPLKDVLKNHYESLTLSDKQLASLRGRLENIDSKQSRRKFVWLGITSAAVAGTALILFMRTTPYSVDGVATEISYNHNKHMDLEVTTASVIELRGKLTKLDFNLIASEHLATDSWQLVGARYCSVHGKVAAQMRYLNQKNGQYYTLYQTVYPKALGELDVDRVVYKDGNLIRVWREKDLLLGLAGPE